MPLPPGTVSCVADLSEPSMSTYIGQEGTIREIAEIGNSQLITSHIFLLGQDALVTLKLGSKGSFLFLYDFVIGITAEPEVVSASIHDSRQQQRLKILGEILERER